ncbi:ankyrin repeat domain-containing protein 9-like [Acipenser oxyrinchus oxyrinchus]|uniref:Ankyrin repeat domain-containing protein 9-like n=1 Tax=Acipenser oxyrinchus oxyrinchus TaxID=40147 RepID=A0AAD8FYN3_ACIOX|nr:ankyrin repeat domain-containing protein 9-like [Acipenser oxyrinchus oxyrinchus]
MPWNARAPSTCGRSDYKTEKQCKQTSFAFYQAVRDLLPVWVLEDTRTMEAFHWEEDGRACAYSPSEALLYALVHDHQPYARYLLAKYSGSALDMPSKSFCCCCRCQSGSSAAPHLAMAVRYNRIDILKMILKTLKEDFAESDRDGYMNRRGCVHAEGGKTPLHLACDLARPECLVLLLGHAASPYVTDCSGDTPLDTLLQQMRQSELDTRLKRVCLSHLILFMPELRFKMKKQLLDNEELWQSLVGEQTFQWLSGQSPPSLFMSCMQSLIRTISPEHFPEGLDALPVPDFMKPLDFRLQ